MSDSLQADSTVIDSLLLDPRAVDSTARLEHFHYSREDNPNTEFSPNRKSAFFVYPSGSKTKREIRLDSTMQYVIVTETIAGIQFKPELKIPLQEYVNLRRDSMGDDMWAELAYAYQLNTGKTDLGDLLSDITNIEIPLPNTSFLSIFGPPKISLRISGAVDIHGAWRNETTEGVTASALGNSRNEPDFKQQVQINVSGTIGDKLTIAADWNTERTFEYENQLKIKYEGYEDEIVQSVEAGNVSLQTSPLVGGSEALFGVKAKFQMGPFTLTALASQKKSEIQEKSVSGGSEKETYEIHAYDYAQNHYFLDTIYASRSENIFNDYYGSTTPIVHPQYTVKDIEVWKSVTGNITGYERKGNAFLNLQPIQKDGNYDDKRDPALESIAGQQEIGMRFRKLEEGQDFTYDKYTGWTTINSLQDQEALAVAYRFEGSTNSAEDDLYFGEFVENVVDDSAAIVLKLIKPKSTPTGPSSAAWKLKLRNMYPIGGREIKEDGFTFDIRYIIEGQDPVNEIDGKKLLELFGLDNTDASKTGPPDGQFDWFPGRTINASTGEIIFPVLEPFGKDSPLPDSLRYQSVYDTTVTYAKQDKSKDKFLLQGEYTADVSSVINIGFNVVENSVRVTLGGRELKEGSDYRVDYNIGQVTIMNDDALVPGADLKISYEQNDLFQLASKTLLGLRGLYTFNKNTTLGFSFLNLNQQTLSDKVRIGEEPLNNSIFGVDFKTNVEMPFLTKALDKVFSTKQMSTWDLKGEFAYINPDPNTKKSSISGDDGLSIAYVDDFEGAKRIIPIGVAYGSWKDLSPPDNMPVIGKITNKMTLMNYKSKSFWFNKLPSDVTVQSIWGNRKQVSREDQTVTALDWVFRPNKRGSFNYNPDFSEGADSNYKNWGGIMKILSSTANNLVEQNIEFIEFWMKIDNAPQNAKLYIDLGQISEDVIPNGELNTEDKNQNDLVDDGEDIGIDMLTNAEERVRYPDVDQNDPSLDNFVFGNGDRYSTETYAGINGTEGNAALTDVGRFPDSEDLNRNFTLDRINSYFRYEIPLDTNRSTNPYIAGGGDGLTWYQFKIPLREFKEAIGNPRFDVVEFIRLWTAGSNEEIHLRFAEMNLVGNQWQKVLVPNVVEEDDTVLTISTINIEDNPEYYPPADNLRERDRTKPDEEVYKNEQSLNLIIKDLETGQKREVVKYLYRPLDLFNYKKLKLFIHGPLDNSPGSISWENDDGKYNAAEFYIRFGADTLNYYEYRLPIKSDWQDIEIDFNELTAIKQIRDNVNTKFVQNVAGKLDHYYGVKGNPALTKVTFFMMGVQNSYGTSREVQWKGQKASGDLWVNEMRVLGADDSPGWAYSASTSVKFADLVSVNFNMSQTNPYFHKLADRFGSRQDKKNWGLSTDIDIIKLLPVNLSGSNLKVSYSHNESYTNPLYQPGTDILVESSTAQYKQKLINQGVDPGEAQRLADQMKSDMQTVSVSDTWSLSNIQLKVPSNKWYVRDTFNSLKWNFSYNKSFGRNPTTLVNRNWVWNAGLNYSVNFDKELFFYPANIPVLGWFVELFGDYRNVKVYFTPQNLGFGITSSRKYSYVENRNSTTEPNITRDFTAKRNFSFLYKFTEGGFFNLSLNYTANFQSSLAYLLLDENTGRERSESEIWSQIFGGDFFGKDFNFQQQVDFKFNPQLPTIWNINKYFNITARYNVGYNWQNNFQQPIIGRSAGYSNSISGGMTLRWKSLTAPLFTEETTPTNQASSRVKTPGARGGRGGRGNRDRDVDADINNANQKDQDSTNTNAVPDSTDLVPKIPIYVKAYSFLKDMVKWSFFDYDQFSVNFSQTNSKSGSGIVGSGSGFRNFWAVSNSASEGPNRAFMMGFSNDIGPRAPNGTLSDNYSQKNTFDFKTSRPLWENADIDITWKVGWGFNKTTSITTDDVGNVTINYVSATGTIDRSFFSLPPFFAFSFLKNGITQVNSLYQNSDPNSGDKNAKLSSAFIEGFETLPLFSKLPALKEVAKFVPRPNYRINWNGLEEISFFKSFAKRVSLNHAYSSTYTEGWKITADGIQQTQTQKIMYGFSPLIGLNLTFDDIFGGDLTGSAKYITKTSYDLSTSTRNVTETFSKDINITASFAKSGFEIPLFGLSLKNDIEVSLSYTSGQNSVVVFEMDNFKEEGKPQDGTIRTTIEPRVKYVMSAKVTLSLFYKRTSVEPQGASRIPPTTTNEAGLDVHIAIN